MLKDTFVYGGAATISKASAFISFPLLAQNLSKADYGLLDYAFTIMSLLAVVIIFGQDGAVARYFYENEDINDQKKLISQSLSFQLICLCVLLPVLWIFTDDFICLFENAHDSLIIIKLIILQVPFIVLINFSKNLLKWTFERNQFLVMSVGPCVMQVCLFYISIKYYDTQITDLIKLALITNVVFGSLGIFLVSKWFVFPTDFNRLREILPFAIPLGVISISGLFLPALERTLVNQFLGADRLGDYAVATKLAFIISFIVNAFQTAWGPFSLSIYKQSNAHETYNMVLKIFCIFLCFATLVITLVAQPLITIFATTQYISAIILVFPLAMGLSIQGISWITELGIGISNRSYLNLYSALGNILITVVGILILVPKLGLLGFGIAVMFGFSTKALLASWLAQKVYPIQWQYLRVVSLVLLTMGTGLIAIWTQYNFYFVTSRYVLIVGIFMTVFLGWFVVLNTKEKKSFLNVFNSKVTKT